MSEIITILMKRDGNTFKEAKEWFDNAQTDFDNRMDVGEDADDICEEHFGLEPDFIMEFMN